MIGMTSALVGEPRPASGHASARPWVNAGLWRFWGYGFGFRVFGVRA